MDELPSSPIGRQGAVVKFTGKETDNRIIF